MARCAHCGREFEGHASGLCDSCETQERYDRAADEEAKVAKVASIELYACCPDELVMGELTGIEILGYSTMDAKVRLTAPSTDVLYRYVLGSWGPDEAADCFPMTAASGW